MKRLKNIVVYILILCVFSFIFTACSNSEQNKNKTSSENEQSCSESNSSSTNNVLLPSNTDYALDVLYRNMFETADSTNGSNTTKDSADDSNNIKNKNQETYIGSKESNKYHHAWCKWAKKIKQSNLITFSSKNDAEKQGYVPCKVCNP